MCIFSSFIILFLKQFQRGFLIHLLTAVQLLDSPVHGPLKADSSYRFHANFKLVFKLVPGHQPL